MRAEHASTGSPVIINKADLELHPHSYLHPDSYFKAFSFTNWGQSGSDAELILIVIPLHY
jgi:hypothetical protein